MTGRILALAAWAAAAWGGDTLMVLHKLDDSLGFYDAATGKLEAKAATGRKPHEFALSADGRWAYVTNYGADTYTETQPGGNTLTVIDVQARKPVGEIGLGSYTRPHGIERGRSGKFYVTTDFPAAVLVVDGAKRKVLRAIPITGKLPHMLEVSADERQAWTADAGGGTVTVVDLNARRVRSQIEVGGVPMGLELTPDEKTLFVATRSGNTVVAVDAVTNRVRRMIGVPGEPVRLAYDARTRRVLVTLIGSGEVAALDARTLLEVKRQKAGARCEGILLDVEGDSVYVSAQGENRVVQFSLPDLERVREIETAAKPDPLFLLRDQKR